MWRADDQFMANGANLQSLRDLASGLAAMPGKGCYRNWMKRPWSVSAGGTGSRPASLPTKGHCIVFYQGSPNGCLVGAGLTQRAVSWPLDGARERVTVACTQHSDW